MKIEGLEVNSPEYWEIRHQREPWPRTNGWVQPLMASIIPLGSKVLEIGCGQGAAALALTEARQDLEITGIDISPTAIQLASRHTTSNVKFRVADVFKLTNDLRDEEYDYIITIQNFEHWPVETQKEALHQMWKRLASGGKLFFTGVGMDWDLNNMNYSIMQYNSKTIQTPNDYHYNKWSEQAVYDLFMTQKARSVKFWRLRGNDRVIAEGEK